MMKRCLRDKLPLLGLMFGLGLMIGYAVNKYLEYVEKTEEQSLYQTYLDVGYTEDQAAVKTGRALIMKQFDQPLKPSRCSKKAESRYLLKEPTFVT